MNPWPSLVHISGVDYGVAFGHWVWYNFWSGIGGSFLVSMLAWFFMWYLHHTCHYSWKCFRFGKYQAAGGIFLLCRKHHPDLQGKRPHHDLIHRLHHEHKARWTHAVV